MQAHRISGRGAGLNAWANQLQGSRRGLFEVSDGIADFSRSGTTILANIQAPTVEEIAVGGRVWVAKHFYRYPGPSLRILLAALDVIVKPKVTAVS